jgi:hypothetical protein
MVLGIKIMGFNHDSDEILGNGRCWQLCVEKLLAKKDRGVIFALL